MTEMICLVMKLYMVHASDLTFQVSCGSVCIGVLGSLFHCGLIWGGGIGWSTVDIKSLHTFVKSFL